MDYRIEKDSLGEMRVPKDALYAAQTQRAVENFPISPLRFPRRFIAAMGMIKKAAAETNAELGLVPREVADAIIAAADDPLVAARADLMTWLRHGGEFPQREMLARGILGGRDDR